MTIAAGPDPQEELPSSLHHGQSLEAERRTLVAFAVTAAFMVIEAAGGVLSGSLALLADAAHMLADVLALLMAWGAFRLGRLAADPRRSYGYRRLEVLAALGNGVTVVILSVGISYAAALRLAHPERVEGWSMLAVALVGLAANVVTFRILDHGHAHSPGHAHTGPHSHADDHGGHGHAGALDEGNLNLKGAVLHVLGDLLGSAAAVGAAAVILATGWTPIDSILSIAMTLLIVVNGVRLIGVSAHILLEGSPAGFDENRLRSRLLGAVSGLVDVHHLHAWSVTTGQPMLTLHVVVRRTADRDAVLEGIKHILADEFGFAHSVVQIEGEGCRDSGCD